jgi:predicted HAD superfamily phosphohydrolase
MCPATAEYIADGRGNDEPLCEDYAHRMAAMREGESYAAMQTLALVVQQLGILGLTDDEMHRALDRTLTDKEGEMLVPFDYDSGVAGDMYGWNQTAMPLAEVG